MKAIRSHYLTRRICLCLSIVMLAGLTPLGAGIGLAQDQKTVLVLPVAVAADDIPVETARRALGALAMAIADTPGMDALQFSPTSPSVRRAVSEGRIRQVDVDEGIADLGTTLTIGHALRADYVVTATLQSVTRKSDPVAVDVILAGQMYEVASNLNPATGEPIGEPKVFRAFGVSGASTPRARYTGSESVLIQEAIRDASAKAAQALSGRTEVGAISGAKKSGKAGHKYVLLGLLLAGLLIAVNSGGGGAAPSDDPNARPVTNLTVEDVDGAIRLNWTEPTGTTLTVLHYRIERAVDGGSFVRIDPGSIGPGRDFFNDYNLLTGSHVYQYRIRTVYTSGAVSPYVVSGAIRVER